MESLCIRNNETKSPRIIQWFQIALAVSAAPFEPALLSTTDISHGMSFTLTVLDLIKNKESSCVYIKTGI